MAILKQIQAIVLSIAMTMMVIPGYAASQGGTEPTSATPSPSELQQLVAPIALYPDGLVAQILAGSTYPTQVVEADRWLQQNKNLSGEQLTSAVNQQSWDDSIKGLTEFPSVLDNMNKNLSWTS